MRFHVRMFSCRQRDSVRAQTLASWRETDWHVEIPVDIDQSRRDQVFGRMEETWLRALRTAASDDADFVLLLEDDLEFNRFLRHNLERWPPLQSIRNSGLPFFGSLYRTDQPLLWRNEHHRYVLAAPESFWGTQAVVISRGTARHLLAQWQDGGRPHDLKAPRLAAQLSPIYCHVPCLVQHRISRSTWGAGTHQAPDFDLEYRAP